MLNTSWKRAAGRVRDRVQGIWSRPRDAAVPASCTSRLNLIIIAAGRCGTSSLYYYLSEHPEVSFVEGPHHNRIAGGIQRGLPFHSPFTALSHGQDARDDYRRVLAPFDGRGQYVAFRCLYAFYQPHMLLNLLHHNPEMKLIVTLRNPVDRTYSTYCRRCERGLTKSFADSIQLGHDPLVAADSPEAARFPAWAKYYKSPLHVHGSVYRGIYYPYLRMLIDLFGREQIYAYRFEQMVRQPEEVMSGLLRFLELDDTYRFKRLGEVKSASKKVAPISAEDRAKLNDLYREFNEKLFDLLDWPHDVWES